MKTLRVYVDASVFSGCFDAPFRDDSRRLLDAVRQGALIALVNEVVLAEVAEAPRWVQEMTAALPAESIEELALTREVIELRDAYIAAGVVTSRRMNDATHVAAATVARADAIASWNFRHIVRLRRIKAYNQVNLANGYGILTIVSPKEVIFDEPE